LPVLAARLLLTFFPFHALSQPAQAHIYMIPAHLVGTLLAAHACRNKLRMRMGCLRMAKCVLGLFVTVVLLLLAGAVALTNLQHLSLSSPPADAINEVQTDSIVAQRSQLTKLTGMLAADQQLWSNPGSQHLAHLTRLQHLSLNVAWQRYQELQHLFPEPAVRMQHLTALTHLHLSGCHGSNILSLGALSALHGMSSCMTATCSF
jgi:hypothetical protein